MGLVLQLVETRADGGTRSVELMEPAFTHSCPLLRASPLASFESEPARKLRRALDAVDRYLRSQSAPLVDYTERHRAGLRVGTSLIAGTANFLVNRRIAKSQQMRWSRRGADRLLQVRCALYNGTLGTGFGQKFLPANDLHPPMAVAA